MGFKSDSFRDGANLPEEAEARFLLRATKTDDDGLSFYNISQMDLSRLGEAGIKDNLEAYIQR